MRKLILLLVAVFTGCQIEKKFEETTVAVEETIVGLPEVETETKPAVDYTTYNWEDGDVLVNGKVVGQGQGFEIDQHLEPELTVTLAETVKDYDEIELVIRRTDGARKVERVMDKTETIAVNTWVPNPYQITLTGKTYKFPNKIYSYNVVMIIK